VLCSANRGLTDEWNDTTQLLLDAARNAQSPELLQVLAQNPLFQYGVFLTIRICLPDEGIYVVCACVCVCVCVCVYAWVCVWFRQRRTCLIQLKLLRISKLSMETIFNITLNKYCTAAFLDISQAFDKVWHEGLLCKIKTIFSHSIYKILKSNLENRYFLI
jgi:hypothetical protein